jgi:hypothetical protein
MSRRIVAIAFVLMVSGLTSATAVAGVCSNMPCCTGAIDGTTINGAMDCCNPVNCFEAPQHDATAAASTPTLEFTPLLIVPLQSITLRTIPLDTPDSIPPRSMSGRLASLATLLI